MVKMDNGNGFTLIELLLVLAIMSILIGLTIVGINAVRQTEFVSAEANNVLASVQKTKAFATNAQSLAINDPFVYGYIFTLVASGSDHGYCIDKWYNTNPFSDPTNKNFQLPDTLTTKVQSSSPPSIDPGSFSCDGSATDASGFGYLAVSHATYDNHADLSYQFQGNVGYIVFENITGTLYLFDTNGKYINPSTITANETITISDTGANNKKTLVITTPNGSPPYIQ